MGIAISLIAILVAFAVACGGLAPVKDYEVTYYDMDQPACLWYFNDKNEDVLTCPGDHDYPADVFCKKFSDEQKDLNFTDEAINKCKVWR